MLKRFAFSVLPVTLCLWLIGLAVCAGQSTVAPAAYRGPTTTASYTPLGAAADVKNSKPPVPVHVEPIPDAMRKEFDIPPFYTKALVIRGMPVIGSPKVSDWAFLECAFVIDHMIANSPERVRSALVKSKVRIGILSVVEYTMDIPENQLEEENQNPIAAAYQDRRSRGLGGLPLTTCGEENLLNLNGDPYKAEDITIHEFSHTVASAIKKVDPDWYAKLRRTYKQAMAKGLFAHTYSATNEQEYWAEGAQAWFDCASPKKDATVHSGIWTREQLKAYDPDLANLEAEVFGDGSWRYIRADGKPLEVEGKSYARTPNELSHLAGLDRNQMPTFDFRNSPRIKALAATQPTTRR